MSVTDLPHPGGGLPREGQPSRGSRWPAWVKVVIVLILLAGLGWVLMLAVQYFWLKKPIGELPGVPGQVAGILKEPPRYVRSIEGVRRPLGVAVSGDGNIYVTESAGERMIRVFDSAGREISSFAPPGTGVSSRLPVYVAVSPSGEVYVSDRAARTIYVFSEDGTLLHEVASPLAEEETWHPLGLTFDEAGNLYVTDVTRDKHRVLVLDPTGRLKLAFGKQGVAEGEFWYPNAVAIDEQGRMYVSDSNNGRIQVFDSSGAFLYKIGRGLARGDLSLPRGLGIDDNDRLFVVDTSRQVVQVYGVSDAPKLLYGFGGDQATASVFRYPNGLALGDGGLVYVTDRENDRVQIWRY